MNAGARLAAFGVAAALVFGAGFVLGDAVGPEPARPERPTETITTITPTTITPTTMDMGGHSGSHDGAGR